MCLLYYAPFGSRFLVRTLARDTQLNTQTQVTILMTQLEIQESKGLKFISSMLI